MHLCLISRLLPDQLVLLYILHRKGTIAGLSFECLRAESIAEPARACDKSPDVRCLSGVVEGIGQH